MFKVARRVAKDQVISTVDPQARHGHKSSARGFDGYKGHIAIDPHSELITDTVVSAGNVGDAVDQRRARTQPACASQFHHVRRFTHDPGALERSEAHWATMFTV